MSISNVDEFNNNDIESAGGSAPTTDDENQNTAEKAENSCGNENQETDEPEPEVQGLEEEKATIQELPMECDETEEEDQEDKDGYKDEELATVSEPFVTIPNEDLDEIVHLAFRIGSAAMKYGSTLGRVEHYLTNLVKLYGYENVIFRGTQTELVGSVSRSPGTPGRMFMMSFEWGHDLNKLGLLAELAKKIQFQHGDITIQEANARLDEIEKEPDVWGFYWQAVAFVAIGASLAVMFGGTWWDSLLGSLGGAICFSTIMLLSSIGGRANQWVDLVASFWCATLASAFKLYRPGVDVALVTLSGCAILLPGFTITLGTSELVSNNILSGAARLVKGIVTMLWLVLGTWLGMTFVGTLTPADINKGVVSEPVSQVWQALFVPIVSFAICTVFQIASRDIPWSLLCMGVTYVTSYVAAVQFERKDLGTFLSAVVMTLCANAWAKCADRPSLIVLLPAFIIKVSGTIGFLGLVGLTIEKETDTGMDQLFEMFRVAVLLIAGILAGNTLVAPETTL